MPKSKTATKPKTKPRAKTKALSPTARAKKLMATPAAMKRWLKSVPQNKIVTSNAASVDSCLAAKFLRASGMKDAQVGVDSFYPLGIGCDTCAMPAWFSATFLVLVYQLDVEHLSPRITAKRASRTARVSSSKSRHQSRRESVSTCIDWNKPLRVGSYPATVVREDHGRRHVTWDTVRNGRADAFVDSAGNIVATLHGGPGSRNSFVENVPEEPKNCIHLYRVCEDGEWEVNGFGSRGVNSQLNTRKFWEDRGEGGVIVEVPVSK